MWEDDGSSQFCVGLGDVGEFLLPCQFLAFYNSNRSQFNGFLADASCMAGVNHICHILVRLWCLEGEEKKKKDKTINNPKSQEVRCRLLISPLLFAKIQSYELRE